MGAVLSARTRADRRSRPQVRSRQTSGGAVPAPLTEQATDFAHLLSEALTDALNALAQRSPEQYLHLRAAQKRELAATRRRAAARTGAAEAAPAWRNEAVVQDLSAHLSFEILHAARRYASFIAALGDYGPPCEDRGSGRLLAATERS